MFLLFLNFYSMNKSLEFFIRNFLKGKGQLVLASLLIGKVCTFLSSLFVIKLLPVEDFGKMSIVAAVFAIFASTTGLGSYQSLLRFGSVAENKTHKNELSAYLLRQGFIYQLLLTLVFLLCSFIYVDKYENIFWIFVFFSIRFIGFYFLNHIQARLRINDKNSEFARINNISNIFGLVLLIILTYFFQLKGYLIALAIIPFLSLFWFKKKDFKNSDLPDIFNNKEIWKYALHASATIILSDALFSLDILLLGWLLNENSVAGYRVAILIPSNVTFLALAFMQSDFPVLAKKYKDKDFLSSYISGYYRFFIPVCLVIFIVSLIFSKEILVFFFNENYAGSPMIFIIFMGTFLVNILFRNLFGNLLSAVGKISLNTKGSLFSICFLIILSLVLVPKYQTLGMAISVSATLLFSGFLFMFYFYKYFKELK